jgi:hypothetical protein
MSRLSRIFPPKWDVLRGLGQSRIVSITIFAPFIGYLIIFNQYIAQYLELSMAAVGIHENTDEVVAANLSRLRQLYVGLTLIGIASILFKSCCPFPINRHKDEYEFIQSELNIMHSERYNNFQERLRFLRPTARHSLRQRIDNVTDTPLIEERSQHATPTMQPARALVWEGWINENRRSITHALATIYLVENEGRVVGRKTSRASRTIWCACQEKSTLLRIG